MKRKLILFLCCLAYTLTTLAQTDLYKRYASRTDIRVASVTNFTLDTGITADVTLLEAVDDQGWEWLCKEFNLARQDPTKPAPVVNEQIDHTQSCYVGVSYLTRTLYVFCCSTDRQSDVVVNYLIEKMQRSLRNKK